MFTLLGFFWIIIIAKLILFYIYLWQLKEYHWGRFLAHFSTAKGKSLLWNKGLLVKIVFLLLCLGLAVFSSKLSDSFAFLSTDMYAQALLVPVLLLYFWQVSRIVNNVFYKKVKAPVFTEKATFLVVLSLILAFIFIFSLFLKVKNIFFIRNYLVYLLKAIKCTKNRIIYPNGKNY